MSKQKSLFLADLESGMENPEFRDSFVRESARIAAIDRIINRLDDLRLARGISKAKLARVIGANDAVIRRFFTAPGNPSYATVAEVADALGMEIIVVPKRDVTATSRSEGLHTVDTPMVSHRREGIRHQHA